MQFIEPRNQIHLYPPSNDAPPQSDPVPRIDLLKESSVTALLCLLSVLFPHQGPRPFYFDHRAMWTASISSTFETPFRDAADLLDAIEAINAWLSEWSSSVERKPNLQPAWAKDRGIDMHGVQALAEAFRDELAKPMSTQIPLFDPDGRLYELRIPSRHTLTTPNAAGCTMERIVLGHVASLVRLQNTFGRSLLVKVLNDRDERLMADSFKLRLGLRPKPIVVIEATPVQGEDTLKPLKEGNQE